MFDVSWKNLPSENHDSYTATKRSLFPHYRLTPSNHGSLSTYPIITCYFHTSVKQSNLSMSYINTALYSKIKTAKKLLNPWNSNYCRRVSKMELRDPWAFDSATVVRLSRRPNGNWEGSVLQYLQRHAHRCKPRIHKSVRTCALKPTCRPFFFFSSIVFFRFPYH